jgi:hypothetical protein
MRSRRNVKMVRKEGQWARGGNELGIKKSRRQVIIMTSDNEIEEIGQQDQGDQTTRSRRSCLKTARDGYSELGHTRVDERVGE